MTAGDPSEETVMDVRLTVHMELKDDGSGVLWWVETPDVAGLSAAGDGMQEAITRAELAAREILADQDVHDVRFTYALATEAHSADGATVAEPERPAPLEVDQVFELVA
jgi:hypothetical protein